MMDTVMYIHCCFEISPVEYELLSERISKESERSISQFILLEKAMSDELHAPDALPAQKEPR